MDCPTDVGYHCAVCDVVGWDCLPKELGFVFLQDVFIRTFNKEAFNADVGQDSNSWLGMPEWIGSNGYFGGEVESLLQKVKPQLVVLYDILVVCAAFIMLHQATAHYFPISWFD